MFTYLHLARDLSLFSVVHAALAVGASGHIVLTKRDVRAAIGWIGLVWLSPYLGTVLYVLLGINRINRKARGLRRRQKRANPAHSPDARHEEIREALGDRASHLLPFVSYMGRLTGLPLTTGNAVEPLRSGDEAYPSMLAAIDGARRSVGLASYIFNADSVGLRFVESLGRAVERGVEVRVLVDAVGARYQHPTIYRALREAGVRTEAFLPSIIPAYFRYFNLRNHRKILVVDGREGFTGGMNINAAFFAPDRPEVLWNDLHFRVRGPEVDTLRKVFADDWAFRSGEVLDGPAWEYVAEPKAGAALARGLIDGPDDNFGRLFFAYLGAVNAARESIAIVTPYFLPDPSLIDALNAAAIRGVTVDIFLPEVNNLTLVQWASTALLEQVLEHGCRVWAVPPPFDHTKLMLVDRAWSFFGSGNWDARSLRLNFEFNVECYDQTLAAALDRQIDDRLRRSRPITKREVIGRSLPIRLRDGTARLLSPYL